MKPLRNLEECGLADRRPARTDGLRVVVCPNCHFSFLQQIDRDKAECARCGNVWPWKKLRLLRARRRG